jgi:superfamily II DNA or RNA helicase
MTADKSTIVKFKGLQGMFFYTGLLPRVRRYCRQQGIALHVEGQTDRLIYQHPRLPGIDLRPDQLDQILTACRYQRGVLIAPPGYGKTVVTLGIMAAYKKSSILFLCHTQDLVMQTVEELEKYKFKSIGIVGMGKFQVSKKYVVATMQTVGAEDKQQYLPRSFYEKFDVVIVDEAHHVSKFDGMYGRILKQVTAPIRIGVTATPPDRVESQMALEGLIGPIIDEMTVEEGADLGLFAMPKIRLFKIPRRQRIWEIRKYAEVYDEGIVENEYRNRKIVSTARKFWDEKKTTLVLVTKIAHGLLLQELFEEEGLNIPFVRGHTKSVDRKRLKRALNDKEVPCVIATAVWKEGINIPSLDVVINAAGGKSEIQTLQSIGRGLRRTSDKDQVIVVDFFDATHKYLIAHFGERISLYFDLGWM